MQKSLFILDATLMLLFVVVMLPHTTGIALHEWLSYMFIIPFLVHILFHWNWIIRIPKAIRNRAWGDIQFNIIWDTLLYLFMLFAIVSGILASEVTLKVMGFDFQPDPFWSATHHQFSNLLFPLVGVHLAMHWEWIVRTGKTFSRSVTVNKSP